LKLDQLRVPFLVLAILLSLVLVLAEAGLPQYQEHLADLFDELRQRQTSTTNPAGQKEKKKKEILAFFPEDQRDKLEKLLDDADTTQPQVSQPLRTFGFGLRYLWLVDGLLLFSLLLIGLGVIVPPAIQARFQGVLTLLYALFVIITAIVLILKALAATILMISMLLAFPFGTIVYLAKWADFNRAGAAAILSVFFTIKLFIAGSVVLAHQRFLQNLGLILIIIGSLVANIIISFLHALVPGFLVSISDAIAGIVVGIVGVILAVVLLIAAILSTIIALR
jgi:hypothetical protein